jgi:hypothetical protein
MDETPQKTSTSLPFRCHKCGKGAREIGCYLQRVNETGVKGIWECRPFCGANMTPNERVLAALEEDQ